MKEKILELVRELGEATTLAVQLGKNIYYLDSLGNDIQKVPQIDTLIRDAQNLRSRIDEINMNVIANAPKY